MAAWQAMVMLASLLLLQLLLARGGGTSSPRFHGAAARLAVVLIPAACWLPGALCWAGCVVAPMSLRWRRPDDFAAVWDAGPSRRHAPWDCGAAAAAAFAVAWARGRRLFGGWGKRPWRRRLPRMPLACAALPLLCVLLSRVPLAHADISPKMYTRLACPSVAHRWLASNYYVNLTTWLDSVPGTGIRHDGLLKNSDTSPVKAPFFDTGQNAMVFSPRGLGSTVGPYVQLPSVQFGNGDFTFYVLAKYSSPGGSGSSWPRIFDFSSTGTSSGVYFILVGGSE